jgi:hypothetical protein
VPDAVDEDHDGRARLPMHAWQRLYLSIHITAIRSCPEIRDCGERA